MIIPAAAAVMTPKVTQPKYLSSGEFTRLPITVWLLVRRMFFECVIIIIDVLFRFVVFQYPDC
jgi:hypothetical protein